MSKSRGTKRRSKQKLVPAVRKKSSQSKIPPQTQPPLRKNFFRLFVNHPAITLIGLFASILGIGYFCADILRAPEISADPNPDISEPFVLPFVITNRSMLFTMRKTELNCGIHYVRFKGGGGIGNVDLLDSSDISIEPQDLANFRCQIGHNGVNVFDFGQNKIVRGHIFLWVTYQTLWIERKSSAQEFTWFTDANPPRWIKGKIAN